MRPVLYVSRLECAMKIRAFANVLLLGPELERIPLNPNRWYGKSVFNHSDSTEPPKLKRSVIYFGAPDRSRPHWTRHNREPFYAKVAGRRRR